MNEFANQMQYEFGPGTSFKELLIVTHYGNHTIPKTFFEIKATGHNKQTAKTYARAIKIY